VNFLRKKRNNCRKIFVLFTVNVILFTFCLMGVLGFAPKSADQAEPSSETVRETINTMDETSWVYACGMPIGIYMETKGVLIIDAGEVVGQDGVPCQPALHIVQSGDYIQEVNGVSINKKQQLVEMVEECGGEELELRVLRNGEVIPLLLTPIMTEDGSYKLGIWVRDNTQGIGTVTYMKENGDYGALGHGISDLDTGQLLWLGYGELYQAQILSVMKGVRGNPGELSGVIHYQDENKIGTIVTNTANGIYGNIYADSRESFAMKRVQIGKSGEVETGKASILTTVNGKTEEYEIDITDIYWDARETNKAFAIEVTDERLLEITGGIVQGMSGSPILQNGKLVGAVTHVFIQDAAKGYGIFIESMM
jgi:stage IV sporulation protein B